MNLCPAGRPRPVAETPVAALVADAPELAKRWLIALIAAGPLSGAERVAIDDLVRQAPALCAEVVRALASDRECDRLAPGGDLAVLAARAGTMAGADEPARAVAAVEALRSVLWIALMAELRDPTPTLVSELAGRLAHVCAVVTAASVSALSRGVRPARRSPPGTTAAATPASPAVPGPPGALAAERPGAVATPPAAAQTVATAHGVEPTRDAAPAQGVDPTRRAAPGRGVSGASPEQPPAPAPPSAGAGADPSPAGPAAGGRTTSDAAQQSAAAAAQASPAVDAADTDRSAAPGVSGEGPASWIGSIGRRLDRFQEDGLPFAVLLIEIADLDRLRQAEPVEELAGLVAQVERAVSAVLRPADLLSRESIGRYWLVTPETDAEGALALAERVAFAVQADATHRGVPLQVAIGTAVCPDDGREAASLAARADIAMYGARASGRPVVAVDESL